MVRYVNVIPISQNLLIIADFDGKQFNRAPFRITIPLYKGTKIISTLRCYPLSYHEEQEDITNTLKTRGEKFRDFSIKEKGQQMFDYDGEIFYHSKLPKDIFGDAEWAGPLLVAGLVGVMMGKSGSGSGGLGGDEKNSSDDVSRLF